MASRDTAAFSEFVSARSSALYRSAYVMVGDHGLAQDLLQEALTKTYVAWPRQRAAIVLRYYEDLTEAQTAETTGCAVGTVIHYGTVPVDVGHKVASFVQTDLGFVFTDKSGEVYFAHGDEVHHEGRTSPDGVYLKAHDSGNLAAWVEFPDGKAPEFVVIDTSTGGEVARTSEGNKPGMTSFRDSSAAYIYGIDDGFVYWRSAEGAVKHEIVTGTETLLSRTANPFDIAVDDTDEMAFYDTATHEDVTPETSGYKFTLAYGWLDDDTATVLALKTLDESQPVDILACTVSTGRCEVAVPAAATYPNFEIPGGESFE